jgi:hypothetical protein
VTLGKRPEIRHATLRQQCDGFLRPNGHAESRVPVWSDQAGHKQRVT